MFHPSPLQWAEDETWHWEQRCNITPQHSVPYKLQTDKRNEAARSRVRQLGLGSLPQKDCSLGPCGLLPDPIPKKNHPWWPLSSTAGTRGFFRNSSRQGVHRTVGFCSRSQAGAEFYRLPRCMQRNLAEILRGQGRTVPPLYNSLTPQWPHGRSEVSAANTQARKAQTAVQGESVVRQAHSP